MLFDYDCEQGLSLCQQCCLGAERRMEHDGHHVFVARNAEKLKFAVAINLVALAVNVCVFLFVLSVLCKFL